MLINSTFYVGIFTIPLLRNTIIQLFSMKIIESLINRNMNSKIFNHI